MESKILFLGTGGTPTVAGKQLRKTGGFLIHAGGHQFNIDPGPGTLNSMRDYNLNPRETTAVFVSHSHITHCNDVNALLEAMTYAGLDKRGLLVCNETLIKGGEGYDAYVTKYHEQLPERIILMYPEKRIGIDSIEIHAIPAKHSDPGAVGFKFFTPEFVLAYSGDTVFTKDAIEFYKNSDILILNVVNPFNETDNLNLNADDAVKIINKASPKLVVITHFGMKMLKADPLDIAREIYKKTEVACIAAKDGMVINPLSYSANIRQRTLNLY